MSDQKDELTNTEDFVEPEPTSGKTGAEWKTEDVASMKCFNCDGVPVEYVCSPCGCNCYCKKCAMKMATGGRCKNCHQLYASMRQIAHK